MNEPTAAEEPADGLKDWETPELTIDDIRNATQGGGSAPMLSPGEGGSDPEYYSS